MARTVMTAATVPQLICILSSQNQLNKAYSWLPIFTLIIMHP